jgi:hypothetical protein
MSTEEKKGPNYPGNRTVKAAVSLTAPEKTETNPQGRGRPAIVLDPEILNSLASMQCSLKEIAEILGVGIDTVRKHKHLIIQGQAKGKLTLRRSLFRNATQNDNPATQIFLAKNLLGMSDNGMNTEEDLILPWEKDDEDDE